jgi:hypothetical protein
VQQINTPPVGAVAGTGTVGLSFWIAKALWNEATYNSGGMRALNWGNWYCVWSIKDEPGAMDYDVTVSGSGNQNRLMALVNDHLNLVDNNYIVTFGISTSLVPLFSEFTSVTDPFTGSPNTIDTVLLPFQGNTVWQDNYVYYTPGTANATPNSLCRSPRGNFAVDA